MKPTDAYHKWVEWSEEDQTYIGKCPDLITGGIHGDDPVDVFQELCEVVQEVIDYFQQENRDLPAVRTRPMMDVI
jgi:predicted RNase H-like HicB family nuclease